MSNEYPLVYRLIDGQLVSGHTSRNGVFVDIRPVTFEIQWPPAHKGSDVTIHVVEKRGKYPKTVTGKIVSDSSVEVVFQGHTIIMPYDSSHILSEKDFLEKHKGSIALQEAHRQRRKEFDNGYASIDLIASQWLLEAPKQARRFSSGVASISDQDLIEKVFGKNFLLTEHEVRWVKEKFKKCLNVQMNGIKNVR